MADRSFFEHGSGRNCGLEGCPKKVALSDWMTFWMNGVLSLTLVIIGLIGNAAAVVSFHCAGDCTKIKRRRRQAFYYYLITFAVWNTGLLIASILFNCIPALVTDGSDVFYLIGYLAGNCCVTANVWLAVTVTIERYLAVSRPLQSRLTSPRRRAKYVCIVLSSAVLAYNLPLLFELQFSSIPDSMTLLGNGTTNESDLYTLILHVSSVRDNIYYQFLYRILSHFLFVSVVPFFIILLLTIKIVCVVRESDRTRAHLSKPISEGCQLSFPSLFRKQSTHSRHADVILTLTAGKFLIFYSLPVIINIIELTADETTFQSEDSHSSKMLRTMVNIANLLIILDGATNSFFYFSWRNGAKTPPRQNGRLKSDYALVNVLKSRHTDGMSQKETGIGLRSDHSWEKHELIASVVVNELRPPVQDFTFLSRQSSTNRRTTTTDA